MDFSHPMSTSSTPTDISNPNGHRSLDNFVFLTVHHHKSKRDIMQETRFILRCLQIMCALIAFISLYVSSFSGNYQSSVISVSGINSMCLISITSLVASLSAIFVYLFPQILDIPARRESRFSRVEMFMDMFFMAAWFVGATQLIYFGSCPKQWVAGVKVDSTCSSWNICVTFSYMASGLFAIMFIMAIRDIAKHGWEPKDKIR